MERLTERAEIDKCPGIWVKEKFANDGLRTWFNGYDEGYSAINKCAEYEDLAEQGKMLILPCKVGDTVYAIHGISESRNLIYDFKIDALHLTLNAINGGFGKTIFLTREEAEAAIQEVRFNHD